MLHRCPRMLRSLLVPLATLAVACSNPSPPPPPSAAAPPGGAAQREARSLFQNLCSTCHGRDGRGDGVAAASLDPKPRDYTDKAWQASVTDDHIRQVILGGGPAVGKSPLMPASPQLRDKPEVVDELVKIVRSYGK